MDTVQGHTLLRGAEAAGRSQAWPASCGPCQDPPLLLGGRNKAAHEDPVPRCGCPRYERLIVSGSSAGVPMDQIGP